MTRKQVVKAYARWAAEVQRLFEADAKEWLPSWVDKNGESFGFEIQVTPTVTLQTWGGISPHNNFHKREVIFTIFGDYKGLSGGGVYQIHPLRKALGLSAGNDKDNFHHYLDDGIPVWVANQQFHRAGKIRDWFANQKGD